LSTPVLQPLSTSSSHAPTHTTPESPSSCRVAAFSGVKRSPFKNRPLWSRFKTHSRLRRWWDGRGEIALRIRRPKRGLGRGGSSKAIGDAARWSESVRRRRKQSSAEGRGRRGRPPAPGVVQRAWRRRRPPMSLAGHFRKTSPYGQAIGSG
jgi:hypothetical protein